MLVINDSIKMKLLLLQGFVVLKKKGSISPQVINCLIKFCQHSPSENNERHFFVFHFTFAMQEW